MTYNRLAKLNLEEHDEIYIKTATTEIISDFDCYDPIENAVSVCDEDRKVIWFSLPDIKTIKLIDEMEFEERDKIERRLGIGDVEGFSDFE